MEVTVHPHGSFCYVELATPDRGRAERFYGELFGWETLDLPDTGGAASFLLRGLEVAGLRAIARGPSRWLPCLSVESADGAAARAVELGATIRSAPLDAPGIGRMSEILDPAGGLVGLLEGSERRGARIVVEPGSMWWNELVAHDVPAARAFYCRLLGWTTTDTRVPTGDYVVFSLGGRQTAGLMAIGRDWGPVAPHWQTFFAVQDCDAGISRAAALGGALLFGPRQVPHVGTFAVLRDPAGAVFAIMQPLLR